MREMRKNRDSSIPKKRAGEGLRLIRVGSIPEKAQEGEKEEQS